MGWFEFQKRFQIYSFYIDIEYQIEYVSVFMHMRFRLQIIKFLEI